jgi:VWFA-related protein
MAQRLRVLGRLVLVTMLLSAVAVFAQGSPQRVVINYTTVQESNSEQILGLFFTVLDTTGQAVLNPDIGNLSIVLDNAAPVEILDITTPDVPFYLTLVIDASGSMGQASNDMLAAANAAVNNAPPNTQFAVIRFNNQVDLIQGFTADRAAVIAALDQTRSVPNSGTCLYDAIFTGLDQLATAPDPARRAVIVFTDGRDELTLGRNDRCSQHTASEVIERSLGASQPMPIYTIGLRGDRNINEQELRNFADATGGISAIGEQSRLTELFGQIMNSLRGQQLVRARVCSEDGPRTATLLVDVGQRLQPDVAPFELQTECFLPTATPLPTNTATPQPLELFIESFRLDIEQQTMTFEVRRAGDVPARQLRIQIADGATGAIQDQRIVDVGEGRVDVIEFPLTDRLRGDIEIIVSALNADGVVISRESEEFGIVRPTATPTPRPAELVIESFSVDINAGVMTFEVRRAGDIPMEQLRVLVNDRRTGVLLLERMVELTDEATQTIELSTEDITGGDIEIVVNGLDARGNVVARQRGDFAVLRPTSTPTATPVPIGIEIETLEFDEDEKTLLLTLSTQGVSRIEDFRLTITNRDTNLLVGTYSPDLANSLQLNLPELQPGSYRVRANIESDTGERVQSESEFQYTVLVTPTPVVSADIRTIDLDNAAGEFIVRVDPENEDLIRAYRIRVVDSNTGLLVHEFTSFSLPPYDEMRFSNAELAAGTYAITLFALDANNQPITTSSVEIDWTPPPAPTATPEPTMVDRAATVLRENPPLAIGVVVVALALIALLALLLRGRRRQEDPWASALPVSGESGIFTTPKPAGAMPVMLDDERTEVVAATGAQGAPAAVFVLKANAVTAMQGQRLAVKPPFSIGRSGSSMNFVNDKTISRNHALITYDGSNFYVEDQGSGNGTFVDEQRLNPSQKMMLRDGSIIRVGPSTELRFEMEDDSTQVFNLKR